MPRPLIVLPTLILAMAATACGEHPASAGIASAVDGPGVLSDPATGADCGGKDLHITRAGRVSIAGDDNLVLGRELGSVAFGGKGNTVNTDNTPELDDRGSGNRVI